MRSASDRGLAKTASKCFIFMYFLLPHWVPATWRSMAQTSIRAELPSGKVPPPGCGGGAESVLIFSKLYKNLKSLKKELYRFARSFTIE